jgi:hypothetical protein
MSDMAARGATGRAGAARVGGHLAPRPSALHRVPAAATAGTGSLPHRDADQAARFALGAYDLPTVPSLPRRSPAESRVAQALVGVEGVTLGPYGTVAIDPARLEPDLPVDTDLHGDQFAGFRTFLEHAVHADLSGPLLWHFAGPLTVGRALMRAGAAPEVAFAVAHTAVRHHLRALAAAVADALPHVAQIAILEETSPGTMSGRNMAITPEEAVDLLSGAMAAVEPVAAVGVHSCGDLDIPLLLDAGPDVVSLPVSQSVAALAGYVDRFLARGGWIAWGAVATEGPIGVTANRSWQQLADLWCALVERGCDLDRLREQCIVTPQCGLGAHGVATVERICRTLHDVARSARSDAARTQLLLRT